MSSEEEAIRVVRAAEEGTHNAATHAPGGEDTVEETEFPGPGEVGDAAFTMPDEATPLPFARHVLGGEPAPPGLASTHVPSTLALGGVPPGPVVAPITPMPPSGAATTQGSPAKKKARRNSSGSSRIEQESVAVSNIGAVHVAGERACLTLQAHVLEMSEAPKQVRIRNNSGSDASKAVVGLVLGDASGLVQVELWGDAATKHHAQLWHAVNNVAEDMFVRVEVTHMEVSKPVSLLPHGKLLSTPRTIVTLLQPPGAFQLMPAPRLLVSNLAELRRQKPPYTMNIKGVVAELGEIRSS